MTGRRSAGSAAKYASGVVDAALRVTADGFAMREAGLAVRADVAAAVRGFASVARDGFRCMERWYPSAVRPPDAGCA